MHIKSCTHSELLSRGLMTREKGKMRCVLVLQVQVLQINQIKTKPLEHWKDPGMLVKQPKSKIKSLESYPPHF